MQLDNDKKKQFCLFYFLEIFFFNTNEWLLKSMSYFSLCRRKSYWKTVFFKCQGQHTQNDNLNLFLVKMAFDSYFWLYFKEMWWIWTWSDGNWAIYWHITVCCHLTMSLSRLAMFVTWTNIWKITLVVFVCKYSACSFEW